MLAEFKKTFHDDYITNRTSKRQLAELLNVSVINHFTDVIRVGQYGLKTEVYGGIESAIDSMLKLLSWSYTSALTDLTLLQKYFKQSRVNFQQIAANMKIWRVPVSKLID